MTANQIAYAKHKEDLRSHTRSEELTENAQKLTARDLAEKARHNYVSENIDAEKARANRMQAEAAQARAVEEARANRESEKWYGVRYSPEYASYAEWLAKILGDLGGMGSGNGDGNGGMIEKAVKGGANILKQGADSLKDAVENPRKEALSYGPSKSRKIKTKVKSAQSKLNK